MSLLTHNGPASDVQGSPWLTCHVARATPPRHLTDHTLFKPSLHGHCIGHYTGQWSPRQVPGQTEGAGDRGIAAETIEKSQHTDFNEDTTNESASVACSNVAYGCERWTLRKNEETRLDAVDMKGLRKILRVSWTAKKTNEWVLNKTGVKRELLDTAKARKLA